MSPTVFKTVASRPRGARSGFDSHVLPPILIFVIPRRQHARAVSLVLHEDRSISRISRLTSTRLS